MLEMDKLPQGEVVPLVLRRGKTSLAVSETYGTEWKPGKFDPGPEGAEPFDPG